MAIRKVSKKHSANLREYKKLRDKFMSENTECTRCGNEATDCHHKKGKIGNDLLDVRYFLALCRQCHSWVEQHPKESKELGYSLNRLDK